MTTERNHSLSGSATTNVVDENKEPKRYWPEVHEMEIGMVAKMGEAEDGGYVEYYDYYKLAQTKVNQLTTDSEKCKLTKEANISEYYREPLITSSSELDPKLVQASVEVDVANEKLAAAQEHIAELETKLADKETCAVLVGRERIADLEAKLETAKAALEAILKEVGTSTLANKIATKALERIEASV